MIMEVRKLFCLLLPNIVLFSNFQPADAKTGKIINHSASITLTFREKSRCKTMLCFSLFYHPIMSFDGLNQFLMPCKLYDRIKNNIHMEV